MKYLILFAIALAFVASIPCEVEARWYPGKGIVNRRAEGRGVFQSNGPVRSRLGACGRAGCG
jgi:hypothetical protein